MCRPANLIAARTLALSTPCVMIWFLFLGATVYGQQGTTPPTSSKPATTFLSDMDSTKGVFGSAGNPAGRGGAITVIGFASWTMKASLAVDLADHLAGSNRNEVFVSSGDAPGVLMFSLQSEGTVTLESQFVLGINQFVLASGTPQNDDIEKIVFKADY